MPFTRSNLLSSLSVEDERYLNQPLSPQSRPMDMFPLKEADPLSDPLSDWNYDSAIDLFSLTPADMDSVGFDFANGIASDDAKDMLLDPPSATISGLTMPTDDAVSLSSDLDSDDQSWTGLRWSIDRAPAKISSPTTRCSSPETKSPYSMSRAGKAPSGSRKTRSFSQDSRRSSTSQDPQMRNAAKRAAHNIIEKRYRTNMNAKFLALEQAIAPAAHKPVSRAGTGTLKKSEILSNALAYIEGIQQDNQSLHEELALLKQNLLPGLWRAHKPARG